jgi:hypothetical protein
MKNESYIYFILIFLIGIILSSAIMKSASAVNNMNSQLDEYSAIVDSLESVIIDIENEKKECIMIANEAIEHARNCIEREIDSFYRRR